MANGFKNSTSISSPSFQSILDESPTEVAPVKLLPPGSYVCVVGPPRYDKSSKKGTPFVEFILRPVAAGEDIDLDDLEEQGGLDGKQIRATFYLTEDAVRRLDQFHEHCGLDLSDEMPRRVRNDAVVNSQVTAVVRHEQSEDGTQTFTRLARTAPAE